MRSDDATTPTLANRPLPPDEAQDKEKVKPRIVPSLRMFPHRMTRARARAIQVLKLLETITRRLQVIFSLMYRHNIQPLATLNPFPQVLLANFLDGLNAICSSRSILVLGTRSSSQTLATPGNASYRTFPVPIKAYSHILAAARPLSRQSLSARDAVNGLHSVIVEEYFDSPSDPHEDGINFFVQ
ncbi:hypothetical protein D9757_001181 [Collybiopsis confluens]|uniref:Uncharacterized protein n=1 Tax=Collybiopsis confluens TaxID=2823264 RepID=A0A8H5I0Z9_9AGAR|nr:hypothetical protein D9757_001181 [Collybiopsis confluens]